MFETIMMALITWFILISLLLALFGVTAPENEELCLVKEEKER